MFIMSYRGTPTVDLGESNDPESRATPRDRIKKYYDVS